MQPTTPPVTVDQVADLLTTVAAANGLVAAEADRISSSRAAVSLATLERLTRLTAELRPGAEARALLSELDPDLLLAGTSVWLARRRSAAASHSTDSRSADSRSAAARAASRWSAAAWLDGATSEVGA